MTAAGPVQASLTSAGHRHRFENWEAERGELDALLDRTPEMEEEARERLVSRSFELKELIINTRCLELPAILAKSRLLLWIVEMEGMDGLRAMRDIHDYLAQQR